MEITIFVVCKARLWSNTLMVYIAFTQRILLWEANLILAGGLQTQDQYRDLRLDIDDMSYEVCMFLCFILIFISASSTQ